MRRFLRDNGLGLVFLVLFLLALVGQAFAGRGEYNEEQVAEGLPTVSLGSYLSSSHFAVDVTENWQSEYLQFFLFVFGTVYLVQRGSPESKQPDRIGRESEREQRIGRYAGPESPSWARTGGWRTAVYSRSLGLVMGVIFLLSWTAQSIAGRVVHNEEQALAGQPPVSWFGYVTGPEFWSRTLQNWQSELLAVASMVVLSIYLRQRGSPESKPVGAPHDSTGVEG